MREEPVAVAALEDDPAADQLARLATLLGAPFVRVDRVPSRPHALVLSGAALERVGGLQTLERHHLLVHDATASGELRDRYGRGSPGADGFEVAGDQEELVGPLAGLRAGVTIAGPTFERAADAQVVASAGGRPVLLRRGAALFSSGSGVIDLASVADGPSAPWRRRIDTLLPFVAFMRWAMGDRCWTLEQACAVVTIDDPVLRPRYGCLDLETLREWAVVEQRAATIAVIPWNQRRSRPETTAMFLRHPDRLSICVHGNDHTAGEFEERDHEALDRIVARAVERMARHEQRTGLAHDRTMVFPQGRFSPEALAALGRSELTTAINGSLVSSVGDLGRTYGELLSPVVARPGQATMVGRRYPGDLFDCAWDLLLQRPVVLVQHHQDFREGFDALQGFTRALDGLGPLEWMPVGRLLRSLAWVRRNGDVSERRTLPHVDATTLAPAVPAAAPSLGHQIRVAARRAASEARDELVHPRPALDRAVAGLRRRLRRA